MDFEPKKMRLLGELGLKEAESKVYLYLLKKKKATVLDISSSIGLARTSVYNASEKLKKLHLVYEASNGSKHFLIPDTPSNIVNLIKIKEKIAQETARVLKSDFETGYDTRAKISFFEGRGGMKKCLVRMYRSAARGIIRQFDMWDPAQNYLLPGEARTVDRVRVQERIQLWFLIPYDSMVLLRKSPDFSVPKDIRMFREVRVLPKTLSLDMKMVAVSEQEVLFSTPRREGAIILFESPAFARTISVFFDYLWQLAESMPYQPPSETAITRSDFYY